jgi:hypothetical protein
VQSELVVLSHLRWTFVWQRPQHIISRLAADRRTWFVEEPVACDVAAPKLCMETHGSVTRVWLKVPGGHPVSGDGPGRHVGFDHRGAATYAQAIQRLLGTCDDCGRWHLIDCDGSVLVLLPDMDALCEAEPDR